MAGTRADLRGDQPCPGPRGPGYVDGPAARDVSIAAVMTCVDSPAVAEEALGDDELDDGRTVAQVVVGQAEFADVLVLNQP